jgi:hypothetical protein
MSQEKILSKVLVPSTGETYTIGVRGSREQVALKLTADSLINWHEYEVTIQNLSDGTSQIKQLSADGECNFEIPLGNRYSITLPYIEGYIQPNALVYTASISSRNIEYSYNNLNEYLTIRIAVRSELEEHTAAMFNGLEVTCKGSNGVNYAGTIQNGQVTILIPYGITYTISMPQFDGLTHNHTNETFVAGLTARNLVYSYMDYNNLHVYGLDAEGNAYTIADIQEMGVEAASAKIIAGAYNDQTLALAPRKDGGVGCGFAFLTTSPNFNASWAQANIDFGVNNTVVADAITAGALVEGCGYYTNHNQAFAIKDGAGESALVMQVGRVLVDAGLLNQSNPTPAFQAAFNKKLTIAGVERSGFLPAFGQIYALNSSKNELDLFFAALGKTAPSIHSGPWWTSCQANASTAVHLYSGNFYYFGGNKTGSYSVLCCFYL